MIDNDIYQRPNLLGMGILGAQWTTYVLALKLVLKNGATDVFWIETKTTYIAGRRLWTWCKVLNEFSGRHYCYNFVASLGKCRKLGTDSTTDFMALELVLEDS